MGARTSWISALHSDRGSAALVGAALLLASGAATSTAWSAQSASPQRESEGAAVQSAYVDHAGVLRWRGSHAEVALFGADYCIMSGSDYRMAGLVAGDRKSMVDEDLAHFARMGFTALRLCWWGDWENSDRDGNLVANDHLDLLDYVIAKARERGIYMLLTPIHTYDPAYADQLGRPSINVGFSRYTERAAMGTDPQAIAAQARYLGQILEHVNPYTRVALKDEPAIAFIELINEPVHHPEDLAGSVRYIDTLVRAVRATGCRKPTFFNVSQDFAIATAIHRSHVDGVSFGWYPTGLVAGHAARGNFLPAVDDYPDMRQPLLAGKPRIVYEFDSADLLSGYEYPAMARTFRAVGAQAATMFAYDMLRTAPFNLGWQTHYLNLVHTPRKAVSAVIAAEAMRRLPRLKSYGHYPDNDAFGDFTVSYDDDAAVLNAADAFMNAGATLTAPRRPASLTRIAGFGSSPLVDYEGTGAYFLDKVQSGVWRLEVYPDAVLVEDPFEQPQPDKVVSRLLYRSWPMTVHVPDLGGDFYAVRLGPAADGAANAPRLMHADAPRRAVDARVNVEPGVWLLSTNPQVDRASLPARIARVAFDEYHVNARERYADLVLPLTPREFTAGGTNRLRVRVANDSLPDRVELWLRAAGAPFKEPLAMRRERGNDFVAELPGSLPAGLYEYAVSTTTGGRVTSFPGSAPQRPVDWPFHARSLWTLRITPADAPLRLIDPKKDFAAWSLVRVSEKFRPPFFQVVPGASGDESAVALTTPNLGNDTPERYAAALYVGDIVAARASDALHVTSMDVTLKATGPPAVIDVSLIEKDGATWTTHLTATRDWSTVHVPLADLQSSRSLNLPTPYPGLWDYWRAEPTTRGGASDAIHPEKVERVQLTVTPDRAHPDASAGVAVEAIRLKPGTGG